jgi:uncharacterized repeat protein (TIGR03803 family)
LFITLLLAACGGGGGGGTGGGSSGGPGGTPAVLNAIAITPANPTVQSGATLQLTATGTYSDGTTRDLSSSVIWASNATRFATVAPGGLATGVALGSTTITATSGGIAANTTLTVTGQVTLAFIYSFQPTPDGGQPNGPPLQASDGNFYLTTRAGGAHICRGGAVSCGAVVRFTPAGAESVLYSFGASATDGFDPSSPLIQGQDGALYGTTAFGGAHGVGTVFRITLDGTYSILYSFGASPADGLVPTGGVIQASDGNFYGTTSSGGANHCVNIPGPASNCGTVFRITPAGAETILHSFGSSPDDGVEPLGPLLQATDGNLYGTTIDGGANNCVSGTHNCGTVFRITLAGAESVIHSFGASPEDGFAPQGSLIQGSDGAFYGTTPSGGASPFNAPVRNGTVFRVTAAGAETVLYSFAVSAALDGFGPAPFLIQGQDGNFYGTTRSGGAFGGTSNGTVFMVTPSGVHVVLYSFGPLNTNPSDPGSGVTQGGDGAFYGVTFSGGSGSGAGTIFRLTVR